MRERYTKEQIKKLFDDMQYVPILNGTIVYILGLLAFVAFGNLSFVDYMNAIIGFTIGALFGFKSTLCLLYDRYIKNSEEIK